MNKKSCKLGAFFHHDRQMIIWDMGFPYRLELKKNFVCILIYAICIILILPDKTVIPGVLNISGPNQRIKNQQKWPS